MTLIKGVVAWLILLSACVVSARAATTAAPPEGAGVYGKSWCVIVNAPYERFLVELARLIDEGAEVQGGFVRVESTRTYSALVCKRGGENG